MANVFRKGLFKFLAGVCNYFCLELRFFFCLLENTVERPAVCIYTQLATFLVTNLKMLSFAAIFLGIDLGTVCFVDDHCRKVPF